MSRPAAERDAIRCSIVPADFLDAAAMIPRIAYFRLKTRLSSTGKAVVILLHAVDYCPAPGRFEMENYASQNARANNFEVRRDARKRFNEIQPIIAVCRTMDSDFKAFIQDVSSSGAFIKTSRPLLAGQEIAMTFIFPRTRKPVMATGEIVRVCYGGVGLKFKIFF
jgi:hypothetical protein